MHPFAILWEMKGETVMTMFAKDIMSTQRFVRWHLTGSDVVNKLFAYGVPGLPVVNDEMNVIGIITEFDVVGAIYEGLDLQVVAAEQIMTKAPLIAKLDTSLNELAGMMLNNRYSIIPIVNASNKLVGVVSKQMMLDAHLAPYICKRVTIV